MNSMSMGKRFNLDKNVVCFYNSKLDLIFYTPVDRETEMSCIVSISNGIYLLNHTIYDRM